VALSLLGPSTAAPAAVREATTPIASEAPSNTENVDSALPEVDPPSAPVPAPIDPFPGRTYGNFDSKRCIQELDDRGIPYERFGHARGVSTPVLLMGPLHGVLFFHDDAPDWITSARREVMDCRLVLALDDFARTVAARGIRSVTHYGIYRGDVPLPAHGRPQHHVAGLAIDVAALVKADGTRLEVRRDWPGYVGARTCSESSDARPPKTESATELRGILCEVAKERMFHQVLTPNHNAAHRDHFHLEVMRGTSWTMVQ
jgi:hypothetical protein